MYRGGGVKEKEKLKIGKKSSSRPFFSQPGRWTGNNSLFEDGLG